MVQKKTGVLVILLTILCLGIVSAETCTIQSSCDPDYTIMKLSGTTNAHGELWSQTNYDSYLCCDFAGTHTCNGANKIIGLSDLTNAHSEIPSLTNYANEVCYGNFVCRGTTDANCAFGEMELMSLSADTNAHIGAFADYTTKICCSGICESGYEYVAGNCEIEQVAYWANLGSQFIDHAYVNPGNTIISLILVNSRLAQGTEVNFNIYEDDVLDDDEIRTITGIVDAEGKAIAHWTITQEDIDTAQGLLNEPIENLEFYFDVLTAPAESSGALTIEVVTCNGFNYCMDYATEEECVSDACMVAEASVHVNGYPDLVCGIDGATQDSDGCDMWGDCACSWNSEELECGPIKIERREADCPNEGDPGTLGTCFFNEDTTDNCDDGFLTYSWAGSWTWDVDNTFSSNPDGGDYIEDPVGTWHFDSERIYLRCIGGSNSLVCPAQIQLPFFTWQTLLATLIILGAIYFTWSLKKKNKKVNKKKTRKKSK